MIKTVVIDDEQPARELIALHLSGLDNFVIQGSFSNAIEGFAFLQNEPVDLIFLDIRMPRISGLELVRSLKNCPGVIFTTAYREYAAEAFELDVLDYLVKPVTRERFMKAISRFHHYHQATVTSTTLPDSFDRAYIFLKIGKAQTKIYLNDILYIEGLKDYIKVHTTNKVFIASERMMYMEEKLPENKFARVHKSFIVAVEKINDIRSGEIMMGNISIPLGRVYKHAFLKKISHSARK